MNSPRLASAKEDLSESDSSGKSSPETVVNRHSKPQELNLEEECEEISEEQHLPSNRKPLRSSSVASTPERRAVEYDTLHEEHVNISSFSIFYIILFTCRDIWEMLR